MYSVLPAIVSILFLFFGLYVVNQKGINRVSTSFLVLCVTTFFWQFTWAALFQAKDPDTANQLIKMGWLLILLLPTALYHFVSEITGTRSDLKYVFISYVFAMVLAAIMIATDWVIAGFYEYFWGYYPKAGPLHPLHVLQTAVVVGRAMYITQRRLTATRGEEHSRLSYCLAGLAVYCLASIDYLCNYGFEFYPPGVLFITVSLGIIAVATTRFQLMDNARAIAASVAHEMRTPMATVKMQAQVLSHYMPALIKAYQSASQHKLVEQELDETTLQAVAQMAEKIELEVGRTSQAIDMLLAITSNLDISADSYHMFSVTECIQEALERYPFDGDDRQRVQLVTEQDFDIHGSDTFFTFVLFNLIKNALYAIKEKGEGNIYITVKKGRVEIRDTGAGIPQTIMPYIFENFYTTKSRKANAGVGLAFCKRVIESFGGKIRCESTRGQGTLFVMCFS